MEPLGHVEDVVLRSGGAALRYGWFYGPGATDDQVELIRRRKFPIVGGGTGYWSWVHLDDAASATVLAVEQKAEGRVQHRSRRTGPGQRVAAVSGAVRGAKRPLRIPRWLGLCQPANRR